MRILQNFAVLLQLVWIKSQRLGSESTFFRIPLIQVEGYCWNCHVKPILMAGSNPFPTNLGIHHRRLESQAIASIRVFRQLVKCHYSSMQRHDLGLYSRPIIKPPIIPIVVLGVFLGTQVRTLKCPRGLKLKLYISYTYLISWIGSFSFR